MAFLDNSGDIILDAVLTDTGRLRLAQGDGSFKITKFALGDDEINYGNYNKDHASGSAYYDLEILQTPVLEAFTNNTANLNSKLMSIARTNLLYMPELLLNKRTTGGKQVNVVQQMRPSLMYFRVDGEDASAVMGAAYGATLAGTTFLVAADPTTWNVLNWTLPSGAGEIQGAIMGFASGTLAGSLIRVDQGLNTSQISPASGLDADMRESQYIMELDYRLGRVAQPESKVLLDVNFIDDDNVASYYIAGATFIRDNTNELTSTEAEKPENGPDEQVHAGPRGSTLMFRLHASTELQYSTYLYTQLGKELSNAEVVAQLGISQTTLTVNNVSKAYVIDTTVRVTGANTGFRMDIPVRYLKIE